VSMSQYTDLVTSEHADKPKFMAAVDALSGGQLATQASTLSFVSKFDLDAAEGQQLDVLGEWIGRSRYLEVPLIGVYFSFDTAGVGFDEGTWRGPFDPITGLEVLPDDSYRVLLRAEIARNQWNGTIPSAYEFLDPVFPTREVIVQDNGDMSMTIGILGSAPLDAVSIALLTKGYLSVKPVGVRITDYLQPSDLATPFFGMDAANDSIAGFDTGSWPTTIVIGG